MRENNFRHPGSDQALGVDDIRAGLSFRVVNTDGTGETGVFVTAPEYGEEGWWGGTAIINGVQKALDVYATGLSRSPDGRWASTYTVALESDASLGH